MKYVKVSDVNHVLLRPDMYVGPVLPDFYDEYVISSGTIVKKRVFYPPGLLKIFDEVLVNAMDHAVRTRGLPKHEQVSEINVTINNQSVIVRNNGIAIPIEFNQEYQEWNPHTVFGNLRSSENFDDNVERRVGGLNGLGASLCNVLSKNFRVTIGDHKTKRHYYQEYYDNNSRHSEPIISNYTGKKNSDFCQIEFTPDFTRFGVDSFSSDLQELMYRRVHDISVLGITSLIVSFNGTIISPKKFNDYCLLFDSNAITTHCEYWDVAVYSSKDTFEQISWVNGIYTRNGGKHVDYILEQVVTSLKTKLSKQHKELVFKNTMIKNALCIMVNCSIDRPSFDGQSKDCLKTTKTKFGSSFEIPTSFIDKIMKNKDIIENIINQASRSMNKELQKDDGKKKKSINIPHYDSAQYAGSKRSNECTLILTEGLSAKTLAMSGLDSEQRKYFGIFPLKGKMLNVRGTSPAKLGNNIEISHLKKILGLEYGKKYESVNDLRYGHIMMMSDQDTDGIHCKSLLFNVFAVLWPSLFQLPGFLCSFQTPIIKAIKGNTVKSFYSEKEYRTWYSSNQTPGWSIKYYKGLGTSTANEAKEYFKDTRKNTLNYTYTPNTDEAFDKAFNKIRTDDRKEWLCNYNPDLAIDTKNYIPFDDFIDKELIHFSNNDVGRSIPNVIDGLKTSQRKVIFACFKRKLHSQVKVAQLSGYTAEHSAYHSGEKSLEGCIVCLAQNHVGSNNINLLMPIGQFGTRVCGGTSDAASPRYIFTSLSKITRTIFPELDDSAMKYLTDDGMSIEPQYYVPVIPMILVNGARGIGTGFSSNIPCYNPRDIIAIIRKMLCGIAITDELVPWYHNFKGTIDRVSDTNYTCQGVFTETDTKVIITELPIGTWTENYKTFLESNVIFKKIVSENTDKVVKFTCFKAVPKVPIKNIADTLKLVSKISTNNMYAFSPSLNIKKYNSALEIIQEHFTIRMEYYQRRRQILLDSLEIQKGLISAKIAFIKSVISKQINLQHETMESLYNIFENCGYPKKDDKYTYLTSLVITTMTRDNLEKLRLEHDDLVIKYDTYKKTSPSDLWKIDLDEFEKALMNHFNIN